MTRGYHGHPERERKRARARCRAEEALARKYPDEFRKLYEAELEKVGLWPPLTPGPPPKDSDAV